MKRLPHRFGPALFALILSGIMTAIVSGVATGLAIGLTDAFPRHWALAWLSSWAVAFSVILLVGPAIRKAVARVVEPPPPQKGTTPQALMRESRRDAKGATGGLYVGEVFNPAAVLPAPQDVPVRRG